MDAKEYDRIADILMQIRGKIPHPQRLYHNSNVEIIKTQHLIDLLIEQFDRLGQIDAEGWL